MDWVYQAKGVYLKRIWPTNVGGSARRFASPDPRIKGSARRFASPDPRIKGYAVLIFLSFLFKKIISVKKEKVLHTVYVCNRKILYLTIHTGVRGQSPLLSFLFKNIM